MILQIKEVGKIINKPSKVAKILKKVLSFEDSADQNKEHFWTIGVNTKNQILYIDLTHLGTLEQSVVHPRDVFRTAISYGAFAIIVGHNHPSGDHKPSANDHKINKKLNAAGDLLAIPCLDHIIIGTNSFYSFHDKDFNLF